MSHYACSARVAIFMTCTYMWEHRNDPPFALCLYCSVYKRREHSPRELTTRHNKMVCVCVCVCVPVQAQRTELLQQQEALLKEAEVSYQEQLRLQREEIDRRTQTALQEQKALQVRGLNCSLRICLDISYIFVLMLRQRPVSGPDQGYACVHGFRL